MSCTLFPLALLTFPQYWLALPLTVAFAFCYAASHAEETPRIVAHALRILFWLLFFLVLVGVILYFAI